MILPQKKNCNKKHLNSNQFFAVALKEYYLLYPDAEVDVTPGEKNLFTVARYKGFLGKPYNNSGLFCNQKKTLLEKMMFK